MDRDGRIWWGKDGNNVPAPKIYLSEVKQGIVPQTYWPYEEVGHTQDAKKDLISLVDFPSSDEVFDTPKPSKLIMKMLRIATKANEGDLVFDFFSGSGTTGQAVMELNKEDGGNRQFILVQLPEKIDSQKFHSLADVGKERLVNVGKRLTADKDQMSMEGTPPLDVGFRVFKLDTTNMKTWDATPIEDGQVDLLVERMYDFLNKVKPKRSDLDVIFEVTLKLGIPLNYPVTQIDLNGKPAYLVTDPEDGGVLVLICLAPHIMPDDIVAMTEYAPGLIVADQESFDDDTAMSNAYFILRDKKVKIKLV